MSEQGRFAGRVAVITGGAGGMGTAAARRLIAEGARVALIDRDEAALNAVAADLGERALPIVADVTVEADVINYVAVARERLGRIDHFFNNAGIAGTVAPITELSLADVQQAMAVNVYGAFLGLREVLRVMREQGTGGTVVNTASTSSVRAVYGTAPYVLSKHAVAGLTLQGALDAAPYGVRVNAVAPGGTDTNMLAGILRDRDPEDLDAAKAAMTARVALGRLGRPEEIANLVVWLLSDESSYVTGSVYLIDGGLRAN